MAQASRTKMSNTDLVRIKGIEYKSLTRPFPLARVQEKYDYMLKLIIVGDSGVGKTNIINAFCNSDYHFTANHVPTIGVDFSAKVIQLQNKKVKLQVWDTAGQQRFRTITQTYYKGAAGIFLVYSVGSRESFNNVKKWMEQINDKTSQNVQVVLIANKIDLPDIQTPPQDFNTQQFGTDEVVTQDTTQDTGIKQSEPKKSTQTNKQGEANKQIQPGFVTPIKTKLLRNMVQTHRLVSRKQGWDLATQFGIGYHQVSAKQNEKIDQIFYNMAQKINSELQQQLNDKQMSQGQQQSATYKISHFGAIELSTKGQKKTKIRSKKGIIYHTNDEQKEQDPSQKKSWRTCIC